MKHTLRAASGLVLLGAVLCALIPPPLSAQDASSVVRVHVLPVVNRSDQAQFDAVATTVTGTVSLTLRLLGNYEISRGATDSATLPPDPAVRVPALAAFAEELQVENIVFGEILPSDDAELPRIRLGVFDRLSGGITVQQERTPQGLFDIFTVTDELAADVLSGFSGRRVAFGSIRITAEYAGTGEPPPYRVVLDGEALGANLRSVDSILTGSHQLTITTEVLGEERVLLDEQISVEEAAPREVALELPDIDLVAVEQDRARREAEERQRAAVRRLQAERRTYSSTLAAELYLTADEFLDPQLIRREARENARVQAQFELQRGRTMLANRRWDEGISTHEAIGELATRFDQNDLFGYPEEIGFATSTYGAVLVQEERNPNALLPWVLFGAAVAATIPTTHDSRFVEPGPPMAQYVPFFPMVFAGASIAIWNATDWDYRPTRRLLRRYGEDGMEAVDRQRPWPQWEMAPGITATMGLNTYRITPGPSGEANDVDEIRLFQASFIPALRVRYWLTSQTAAGGELRVAPIGGNHVLHVLTSSNPMLHISELFQVSGDWSHTRTGRTILDAGLTLRLLELSTDTIRSANSEDSDVLIEETYEELLGGSTAFVAIPGVRTGFELRFGRGELPPWGFSLHYRVERA
ncbi:MAG TPA: hypothetical protein VJ932_02000, partial [Alkalispirochaeta sp.]|nr:hypothetical protein [Alkalispirochaeta sp.]